MLNRSELTPSKISRRDILKRTAVVAAVALAVPLAGCGKKSPPKPPAGDKAPYPRKYPAPA